MRRTGESGNLVVLVFRTTKAGCKIPIRRTAACAGMTKFICHSPGSR